MRDFSIIQNSREREFAQTFFDHEDWEYQPGPFPLSVGGSYRPDFKDNRRGCLIEVVGSRQAFNHNRYKYEFFKNEYDIPLEFRRHTGEVLNISHGVLHLKSCRGNFYSNGIIYPSCRNCWDLRFFVDRLRVFFIATRWRFKDLGEWLGLCPHRISCVMQGMNPYCSEQYFRTIACFLDEFSSNPLIFPKMEYPHSLPEKIAQEKTIALSGLRFAFGLPYESGHPLPSSSQPHPDEAA